MYITAKMWVQNSENEDAPATVLPVVITSELNDTDQIFLDLNLPEDVIFQLELGGHAASMMAFGLMELAQLSIREQDRDVNAAMKRLNKTTEEE